jgi:hypothetical protein
MPLKLRITLSRAKPAFEWSKHRYILSREKG